MEMACSQNSVKRFFREAKAASCLNSPHTITVHDFGQTSEGILYIALEYLRGKSLAKLLKNEQGLAVKDALAILIQIALSLEEATTQVSCIVI